MQSCNTQPKHLQNTENAYVITALTTAILSYHLLCHIIRIVGANVVVKLDSFILSLLQTSFLWINDSQLQLNYIGQNVIHSRSRCLYNVYSDSSFLSKELQLQ